MLSYNSVPGQSPPAFWPGNYITEPILGQHRATNGV